MTRYSELLKRFFFIILIAALGCNDDDVIQKPVESLVAIAGADQSVKINEVTVLDASASYAKDDKPFAFLWAIKSKPEGSTSTIENNKAIKTTFRPDKAGTYILQLTISRDNQTATDDLKLTVTEEGEEAPQTILLSQDLMAGTTLEDIFDDPTKTDYRVTKNIIVRGNLLIAEGVVIEFEENTGLEIVSGYLQALGSGEKKIVFKGVERTSKFWKGVFIHTNSDQNELKHVEISDAGGDAPTLGNSGANVVLMGDHISGASLSITNSSFSNSGAYGLYVQGMSSINEFAENSFDNNKRAAAYIPAGQLHRIDDLSFSNNKVETGGNVFSDQTYEWKNLIYHVTSDITINSGINIQAGAQFRFDEGRTLSVLNNGFLNASGTATAKVVFTSSDNNKPWSGIYINSYSHNNDIDHAEISYAGSNRIADADHEGNIYVGTNGLLKIQNSILKNGKGYGIVTKNTSALNADVTMSNTFADLLKGNLFPVPAEELPSLEGVWLDQWSFTNNVNGLAENFYNPETQIWFGGTDNPWAMVKPGFGIRIEENGHFSWYIAEHSPMTGCVSYSAEYIMGNASINQQTILFQQDYWRSKFVNLCDENQNVDTNVTPIDIELPYTITKMYNLLRGEQYWELKFTNPDQSVFKFYRR